LEFPFFGPQVSHHPPISTAHAENEHFTYDITSKVKTRFMGNSLDIFPIGRQVLLLRLGPFSKNLILDHRSIEIFDAKNTFESVEVH